jgi:hypothetical protein
LTSTSICRPAFIALTPQESTVTDSEKRNRYI